MGNSNHERGDDRALLNHWLSQLGAQTRIPLSLDDDGVCAVGHASGLDCVIEVPRNGSVYLRVSILPWEPEDNPDMAERCLLASFMGMNTGGAAFGVDPVDAELALWREVPLSSLDGASFALMVAQILDAAVHWRAQLLAAEESALKDLNEPAHIPAAFSMQRV